jgi:hypothetical protein
MNVTCGHVSAANRALRGNVEQLADFMALCGVVPALAGPLFAFHLSELGAHPDFKIAVKAG